MSDNLIDHMTNMNVEEKNAYLKIEKKFQCGWCNRIMEAAKDDSSYTDLRYGPGVIKKAPGTFCRDCKSTLGQYGRAIRSLHWMKTKALLSCVYCGLSDRPACIEFDHFDSLGKINERNKKRMPVSYYMAQGTSSYPMAFYEEMLKCLVICSNCHSEKTKHETTYEDSYRSERILNGDYTVGAGGVNGNIGTRRKTPTTGDIIRKAISSPWEGRKINRALHERNLKIIYDETFSYFMSGRREAWDTHIIDENGKSCISDWWNWEWKITPSSFGRRTDIFVTKRPRTSKEENVTITVTERNVRDTKLVNELLKFDWKGRMDGGKDLC